MALSCRPEAAATNASTINGDRYEYYRFVVDCVASL
jgi:hypothetical protein